MANKINVGNPELTTKSNILDIDLPIELENAVSTGWDHFDALCAGDGMIPSTVAILTGLPGAGKCLAKDTLVLMYNGETKPVQNIVVGDLVMGPDSRPRKVASLASGQEEMFEVQPTKGEAWSCNRSHILSLVKSGTNIVQNLSIDEYLALPQSQQFRLKQYRVAIDFENTEAVPFDPYLFGYWLGDGTTGEAHLTTGDFEVKDFISMWADKNGYSIKIYPGNGCETIRLAKGTKAHWIRNPLRSYIREIVGDIKHIPREYQLSSKQNRLRLLAGYLDADGHLSKGYFEASTKSSELKDDLLFLARSLGFAAYAKHEKKSWNRGKTSREYWRITISGCISTIPTLIRRKQASNRKQIKNVLRTGIKLTSKGKASYYGFTLEGPDHLFVLGDFTVTHNTTMAVQLADAITSTGNIALYNTCEESIYQVRRTAKRMNLRHGFIPSYHNEVSAITAHADAIRTENPGKQVFLFVDSLQTVECNEIDPKTGKIYSQQAQITQATWRLAEWAKKNYTNVIIIGQVTKDGTFAGKQEVKHAVDLHLHMHLDTDRRSESYNERIFEVQKNRFGSGGLYFPYDITGQGIVFKS